MNTDLLKFFIYDVMCCLINEQLEEIESTNFQSVSKSGEDIKKALNTCTLKIFECAKSQHVIISLISIILMVCDKLESGNASFNSDELNNIDNIDAKPNMVSLACRCLFKMLKLINSIIKYINVTEILNCVAEFMQKYCKS